MNLYLIDGNSYVYRAFYAIKGLTNSRGFPTNAIFGFTNMLLKIIREKKPDALAVSFDSPEPTERHRIFRDYKAQRPETPSELVQQLPHIREIISSFNLKMFEVPGYEADDLIGTVAKKAAREGNDVFIVTADKDMLQLVDEHIKVYDPMKEKLLDEEYVREKFGVGPERITEFMALTGDAVDNIPGIKGVGEKTARELLTSFGSLEELLQHTERIKKERLRILVADNKEVVRLSQQLATIDTSAPVEADLNDFRLREPDWLSLLSLFKEFEFTSLMKLLPAGRSDVRNYETVTSVQQLRDILGSMSHECAFDIEATGRNPLTDSPVGIALCSASVRSFYIPFGHTEAAAAPQKQLAKGVVLETLRPFFEDQKTIKIGHNLKYDIMLMKQEGIRVEGQRFDTMIASYLLNPSKPGHSLDEVSFEHLSKRKKSFMEVLRKRASFADVTLEEATPYAAEDAALSFELKEVLARKLAGHNLEKIFSDIELPLIDVLIDMEEAGIKINAERLKAISEGLSAEIESIQQRIYFLAGEEFNINSPKQLAKILFQHIGLKPTKKTKTGFSTGMDVLGDLAEDHELPGEVLNYRSLTKLKTTYVDVLPSLVNPKTGRVHTSFNQTITATGRLSSSEPNLQNIPVRGDRGKLIREAFIAEDGCLLLSADYSQVELRILAHLSRDEGLTAAFIQNLDIHARTASEIYDIPLDRVTPEMRRTAKTVNFGVIYGISPFGLSETLKIERKDAEKFIKQYFERHPGVKDFTERVLVEAEQNGFVTTLFGRKRPVPELRSKNRNIRQQGERFAVNSPIQGTAADIIKRAMITINRRLKNERLRCRMILQVHDELLFELPEPEKDLVFQIVKKEMEQAAHMTVPLKVDIGYGRNWAEAH